jgi:hypothetical protein
MKRTPLRRLTPLHRHTRLRPSSAKGRVRAIERRAFVATILAQRPKCEFCGCCASVDCHEPLTRARGGSVLDESNTVAVCRGPGSCDCHGFLHDNPTWATEHGLLRPSWQRPCVLCRRPLGEHSKQEADACLDELLSASAESEETPA